MTTRIRIARMLTTAVAMFGALVTMAPSLHAQKRPDSSAPIPFYSHANGEPLHEREDTQIAVFEDDVPEGKRLVVQYVSLSGSGNVTVVDNNPREVGAICHITGRGIGVDSNGNPNLVRHLLPLISRNPDPGTETFTAALQVTIYLEPGPHGVLCSGRGFLSPVEVFVTGQLVAQ